MNKTNSSVTSISNGSVSSLEDRALQNDAASANMTITGGSFSSVKKQTLLNQGICNISGGTFTCDGAGNTVQNGTAETPRGALWITGGIIKQTGTGTTAVKNFSNTTWSASNNLGKSCSVGSCSIHIGGTTIISNTGSGYGVHNEKPNSGSGAGSIHFPDAYTGYVHSKNSTCVRVKSGGAQIKMNGGNLYSPGKQWSSGSVSIDSDVKKYAQNP